MKKHLAIKYFDTYAEDLQYFDSKENAIEYVNHENEMLKNRPLTSWEYRGEVEEEEVDE